MELPASPHAPTQEQCRFGSVLDRKKALGSPVFKRRGVVPYNRFVMPLSLCTNLL